MEKETKKDAAEERIVVLESGNAMDISILLFFCCGGPLMPIRGY